MDQNQNDPTSIIDDVYQGALFTVEQSAAYKHLDYLLSSNDISLELFSYNSF